ncbi:MAG: cation:proton antiporter [Pseudomonadota bacterium]|jgi:Kef-type K+ transport system membrane component KefB
MTTTETFLLALSLILGLPWLIWRVGRTDTYVPLVVIQIGLGVVMGPGIFGAIAPTVHAALFPQPVMAALNGIAWWAVMLFVWIAGVELDVAQAWRSRRDSWITAALALIAPLILGSFAAWFIVQRPGWIGGHGAHWQAALGIGMACAVTALPILVLFMDRLTILRQPLGQRVLRYASLDDIALWSVLAIILLDWGRLERQLVFVLIFPLAAWALRRIMTRLGGQDRLYVAILCVALLGFAADWAGLHFMVGAFLAGAIMDRDWFDQKSFDLLRDHLLMTIMPVFFLSTGLRTQWTLGGAEVFAVAAILLVASVCGKMAGVAVAGRWLGWKRGEASLIGWLLQTKALIMIIFANILLDRDIISSGMFTALLLMALASTALTIPMVRSRIGMAALTPTIDPEKSE